MFGRATITLGIDPHLWFSIDSQCMYHHHHHHHFFNDKLTIATHYKIKDKYNTNNVGLTIESSNTYKNKCKCF